MEAYESSIGNLTIISCQCRICKKDFALKVKKEDHTDYISNGKLIQNAFPYLTAGERELIITEICETCFDDIFKEGEEPEENMPESYEYNNRD